MASKKKQIIEVNQKGLTLPTDLIPKDVSRFSVEVLEDGRLLVSPIPSAVQISPASQTAVQKLDEQSSLASVIDIRLGRKRAKKTETKNQKQSPEKNLPNDEKPRDDFSLDDGFVRLHHFSSRLEAEMFGEILRQSELPFLIQSEDIGIFGPSAAPAPGGARLVVRKTDLAYAKTLLAGLI